MNSTFLPLSTVKRIFAIAVFLGLVAASSTLVFFPAHSKEKRELSNQLKSFIAENLNKKVWFGIYLKDKKWGYGYKLLQKDSEQNLLIVTVKSVVKNEEENKKFTQTSTIKQQFSLSTGELKKCSDKKTESKANVESLSQAEILDGVIVVKSPSGNKTTVPWDTNFNLETYSSAIKWIRSNPKIGSSLQIYDLDCTTGKVEKGEATLLEAKQKLLSGKKERIYKVRLKDETLGEIYSSFTSDGTEITTSLGSFKMFNEPEHIAKSGINYLNAHEATGLEIKDPIKEYQRLSLLNVKIVSSSKIDFKNSFQQVVEVNQDGSYSISLGPKAEYREKFVPSAYYKKIQRTAKYPVNSPVIIALTKKILDGAKTTDEKVWRLIAFVSNTLIDDYLANSEDALEILKRNRGDCTEHSILFTTLARAAGIPAREVSGLVYNNIDDAPGFGGHGWVEVALDGEWIAVDPTWRERVSAPIRIKLEGIGDWFKIDKIEIVEKLYNYQAADDLIDAASEAYEYKEFETAFSLYKPLAEKGDAYSQYALGWAFEHGEGAPRDYQKAYYWYLKAAQQGQGSAELSIGRLHSDEKYLANNPVFASFWYERSAVNGNKYAAYRLAEAYENGTGVPLNKEMALQWYKTAASSVFD